MPTSFVSTPCCASACSRTWPAASTAAWSTSWLLMRCSRVGGGSFHGEPFTAGPSSISSCSVSTGSSGSGSCTFGLRGPGGRRRWAASGSSRSMSWSASWSKSCTPCAGAGPPPIEKRFPPTRLAASTSASPAGRVAAAVLSAATRTGTRVSTTRPASTRAPRMRPAPHGAMPAASGPAAATPSRPPASTSSSTGASSPGRPLVRWSSPQPPIAIISPPTQRYDCEARSGSASSSGTPRTSTMPSPTSPTGTMTRPHPTTMPMPSSRPRPTGPAALAYTPMPATIPTAMQRRPTTSPAWLPSADASAAVSRSSRDGGGAAFLRAGARLVPPPRGRWVVATVATTVPVTTTATRETTSVQDRTACGGSCTDVGGQRFRWQVGQYVVPLASMTDAPQLGAAAEAGLAGAAVGAELELVAAGLAVGGAVVAQRGAAVGDALFEDGAQLDEQPLGLLAGDRAPARVHAGPPQGLVGVDVADAGERVAARGAAS